jgi:hypothetical protein
MAFMRKRNAHEVASTTSATAGFDGCWKAFAFQHPSGLQSVVEPLIGAIGPGRLTIADPALGASLHPSLRCNLGVRAGVMTELTNDHGNAFLVVRPRNGPSPLRRSQAHLHRARTSFIARARSIATRDLPKRLAHASYSVPLGCPGLHRSRYTTPATFGRVQKPSHRMGQRSTRSARHR